MANNWILTANSEGGTQLPTNQRPDFVQAKRESTQQEYRDVPRSLQMIKRKGQQFEGNEEYDHAVDPETGWRFYQGSRGNLQTTSSVSRANLQTASSSSSTWDHILQALTTGDFFLRVRTGFGWLAKNLQPTDGRCEQHTHKARTEVHSMITFHHGNTRGSRAGRLRIAHLCALRTIVIHVSCLSPCRT